MAIPYRFISGESVLEIPFQFTEIDIFYTTTLI
jgi:hypothetical protein